MGRHQTLADASASVKISDRKIQEIAKRGLPLPESARLAGMARRNFRNRAEKLGYEIKPGRSGRPRLFPTCSIRGCTARYHSNGRCLRHFNEWKYKQNSAEAKDRAKKQREASRKYVPQEELERLRRVENRGESLAYKLKKKIVCLECGWLGDDLNHHIRHCAIRPEDPGAYSKRWGFDLSTRLVSPKYSETCSQIQRKNWASFERRSSMARSRWGRGAGPRSHTQKVSNKKILEAVASNPGLSLIEGGQRTELSRSGFYKRVKEFRAPRSNRPYVRLASNSKLRAWIASQSQEFSAEEFMRFCTDNLDRGQLGDAEFASSVLELEKELRENPTWIAKITAEVKGHKPAQSSMQLGNRVFARVIAGLKGKVHGLDAKATRRGPGAPKGARSSTKARITIAASLEIEGVGRYRGAPEVFPGQGKDRAYENIKDLYGSYNQAISVEKVRLLSLSDSARSSAVSEARKWLNRGK